jgi:hypothetical protein
MPYKNKTKLPIGVQFERIFTTSPENISTSSVKEHIIEWSDIENREIEKIDITQYTDDWQSAITPPTIIFKQKELTDDDDGFYKIADNNSGVWIQYNPYTVAEKFNLWYIVSIKLKGEESFDIAFYSFKDGGNPPTQGDANKPAGGGG